MYISYIYRIQRKCSAISYINTQSFILRINTLLFPITTTREYIRSRTHHFHAAKSIKSHFVFQGQINSMDQLIKVVAFTPNYKQSWIECSKISWISKQKQKPVTCLSISFIFFKQKAEMLPELVRLHVKRPGTLSNLI